MPERQTLHEILRTLPSDMRLRSHVDGKIATVAELLAKRDEPGLWLSESRFHYGTVKIVQIVCDYGVLFSEFRGD